MHARFTTVFMMFFKICILVYLVTGPKLSTCLQRFELPPTLSGHGLQVDATRSTGKVYASAGNRLHRLNSDLQEEESKSLMSNIVKISLSTDDRWLVVCLTDLSCEVYNATNLSTQPVFRQENSLLSPLNISLFATKNSFYVGSVSNVHPRHILLSQHIFTGNRSVSSESKTFEITSNAFQRNFYGGFVKGSYAYYFATDNNPPRRRSIRVMRVCHNSNFGALYELSLSCGGRPGLTTRVSGVNVVDNYDRISGAIVLSSSRPGSTQNSVCAINLEMVDSYIQQLFNSCVHLPSSRKQFSVAWRPGDFFCSEFSLSQDICHFTSTSSLPAVLDEADNVTHTVGGNRTVFLGRDGAHKFITAMTAAVVESFLFTFVAFTDSAGDNYIIVFDVKSSSFELTESDGFGKRMVMDGPVHQLQVNVNAFLMYAITDISVIRFSFADCVSQEGCTGCLGNGNPLCGWCVVENKCSKMNGCQNSFNATRWIRANRTNTGQCPTIIVTPEMYHVDDPTTITLMLTQSLPSIHDSESFVCFFATNIVNFTVDASGSGTNYTCNITGHIPPQLVGLSTVLNVSLASSLLHIPFSTRVSGIIIYRCNETNSCSQCLQTKNACGWCVYNKVCSRSADPCSIMTDNYLKLNLSLNQTFIDVCPLLDQPFPGENYVQPVLVNRNIELVTRNLPPQINGFNYTCLVNGISLPATYVNETSLTCAVNINQLTLPSGTGQIIVDITVLSYSMEENINHQIDGIVNPIHIILFSCADLANSCSSCLSSGFDCRWCDRPSGMTDSCTYTGECTAISVSTGIGCPIPIITDLNPKSGPLEGGTIITFTGRELGVHFDDINITVGGAVCTTVITDHHSFIPGTQISCISGRASSVGPKMIILTTLSGSTTSADLQFRAVVYQIYSVVPSFGPVAGGTKVTVFGSNLNTGNQENARVTIGGGTTCSVDRNSIKTDRINCTTHHFSGSPDTVESVFVIINNANVSDISVQFSFRLNPEFYHVIPSKTILAGGLELIFIGTYLDVVRNPILLVNDLEYLNVIKMTSCTVINSTAIGCVLPSLAHLQPGDNDGLNYTIIMDNAPGPDLTMESLQISVMPNPRNFTLKDSNYNTGSGAPIRIMGDNLRSVSNEFIRVTVGGISCDIIAITEKEIECIPPNNPPDGVLKTTVIVLIGLYLHVEVKDNLNYIMSKSNGYVVLLTSILIPLMVTLTILTVSSVTVCVFMRLRRKEMGNAHHTIESSDYLNLNPKVIGKEDLKQELTEMSQVCSDDKPTTESGLSCEVKDEFAMSENGAYGEMQAMQYS